MEALAAAVVSAEEEASVGDLAEEASVGAVLQGVGRFVVSSEQLKWFTSN